MTEIPHIGQFYVDNLIGNLDGTVRVAKSTTGGVYPVGTVLQLVPTEVMVKREKGFNAATHDWEFFELDVSPSGSTSAEDAAALEQLAVVVKATAAAQPGKAADKPAHP